MPETQTTFIAEKGGPRGVEGMPNEEYHAHPAIGASMIETFRRSRREYHAQYIAKTKVFEPSDAMRFGTIVHLLLLEPERAADEIAPPMPATGPDGEKWDFRKKAHKEVWATEEAERANFKYTISAADWERAQGVLASVKANRHARWLVEADGVPEYSIFWIDSGTGLECKCRLDWFAQFSLDIKTTRDPTPDSYVRDCVKLGYYRKKSHYLEGMRALLNEPDPQLVHLAVETSDPYRIGCYRLLDPDPHVNGESLGAQQRRSLLWEIRQCMETGDWREPWERRVFDLEPPRWAFTEDSYLFTA